MFRSTYIVVNVVCDASVFIRHPNMLFMLNVTQPCVRSSKRVFNDVCDATMCLDSPNMLLMLYVVHRCV